MGSPFVAERIPEPRADYAGVSGVETGLASAPRAATRPALRITDWPKLSRATFPHAGQEVVVRVAGLG
jgi:hypothetical protein